VSVLTHQQLDGKLAEIVRALRNALSPLEIYFFGSYVYGTPAAHSDLDLLVVVDDSNLTPFERDAIAYRALSDLGVPKDVMVYTRSEFERRASLPVSFERTVRSRGRRIYVAG
jgi:predicted nucleotidyltransferase